MGHVVNAPPARSPQEQSAAAPSPFPPIADYAFLSNCHTGALVAPDGGIGWLCVPRFDSPSVFGTLLDRQGGYFRLAPFGIDHPTARVYEPGTNVLATTWKTPSGWVVVRDALTMGRREREDVITPHTRPPADDELRQVPAQWRLVTLSRLREPFRGTDRAVARTAECLHLHQPSPQTRGLCKHARVTDQGDRRGRAVRPRR